MKRIIFLKNLNETNVDKAYDILTSQGLEVDISLASKSITIEGNNDQLAAARRILLEYGFEVL